MEITVGRGLEEEDCIRTVNNIHDIAGQINERLYIYRSALNLGKTVSTCIRVAIEGMILASIGSQLQS